MKVFGKGESRSLFSGFVWVEVLSGVGGRDRESFQPWWNTLFMMGYEKWGFCGNDVVRALSVHRPLDCCNSVVDDKDH